MKTTLAILLLAITAAAQQPTEKFKPFTPADAVYWGGAVADISTSVGKREAGLFHDSSGRFAAGPNAAFKAGLWTAFKALEWRYNTPHERRIITWVKIGAGAAFAGFAIHNAGISKATVK